MFFEQQRIAEFGIGSGVVGLKVLWMKGVEKTEVDQADILGGLDDPNCERTQLPMNNGERPLTMQNDKRVGKLSSPRQHQMRAERNS